MYRAARKDLVNQLLTVYGKRRRMLMRQAAAAAAKGAGPQ